MSMPYGRLMHKYFLTAILKACTKQCPSPGVATVDIFEVAGKSCCCLHSSAGPEFGLMSSHDKSVVVNKISHQRWPGERQAN